MRVVGYVFLKTEQDQPGSQEQQQQLLIEYAKDKLDRKVDYFYVENEDERPFVEREQGSKLLTELETGDHFLVLQAAWVLGSASQSLDLLRQLAGDSVSLHCLDLGENISVSNQRKLVVSEGAANLVFKLLDVIQSSETAVDHEMEKRSPASEKDTGVHYDVPSGWQVYKKGVLMKTID